MGAPSIERRAIPGGLAGTRRTVAEVAALIRAGAADFYVRQHAIDVLLEQAVEPKDYLGEIRALFAWVQRNVRYTRDPYRIEVLHSARRMLELRAGDCDDMTVLLGALLEAVGHPVRLVLTGPDPSRPPLFSHIYLEASHRGEWVPLDPTMPHPPGWAPRTPVRAVVPINRSEPMVPQAAGTDALAAAASDSTLPALVRQVGRGGLAPGDRQVLELSRRLAGTAAFRGDRWLRAVLRYLWDRGLPARPHPHTARRLAGALRRAGLLPGAADVGVPATPAAPADAPAAAAAAGAADADPGAIGEEAEAAGRIVTPHAPLEPGTPALPTVPVALSRVAPVRVRRIGMLRPATLQRLTPLTTIGAASAPGPCPRCG